MKAWLNRYFEEDIRIVFLAVCIFQGVLIFIQEDIIGFRADFFELLNDIGDTGISYGILKIIEIGGYLFIPIQIAIRSLMIGLLLWLGTFAFGYKATYKSLFSLAIYSHIALFISQILKILWFGFVDRSYTQLDLDQFHNFSFLIFIPMESRGNIISELFSMIHPGMLLYLWLLTQGLVKILKRPLSIAWPIVITFILGIGGIWTIFVHIVK